ncbi:Uncharacterised protein [Mycobacteroides abscessus subsp. abscessus]|nr:Uncharacterised protein [Mycobacteroides abscessus subsp. abscessus]
MQFIPNPPIDPMRIITLVQKNKHIKISGPDKLRIEIKAPDLKSRVEAVRTTLRSLV